MGNQDRGVFYWLVGNRHDEHFVVSLLSLRDVWPGPVFVLTGDDHAFDLVHRCSLDPAVGPLIVKRFRYDQLKRRFPGKSFYLAKCLVNRHSPFERTVFLDADTLVLKPFDDVFPEERETVLTQFADWVTNERPTKGRIKSFEDLCITEATIMLGKPHPSINTGVFGWHREHDGIFDDWFHTTSKRPVFMADEIVMQLIYVRYDYRVLDDRWNWSPKFSRDPSRAIILHGHGYKAHRTEAGKALWVPHYERAKELNVAGIREWTPTKKFAKYYPKT